MAAKRDSDRRAADAGDVDDRNGAGTGCDAARRVLAVDASAVID